MTADLGRFLCWWGFHNIEIISWDGASFHARCKRCGRLGMIDSQGNLF